MYGSLYCGGHPRAPENLTFTEPTDHYDDDDFIKLPGLPKRGMLCGYKNGSSTVVASPSIQFNVHLAL